MQNDTQKSLDALDRSLQDLRGGIRPFGNTLILLTTDSRQSLPVIPRSTAVDEINACRHVKTLRLTTITRVQLQNDPTAEIFSHHLLGNWERKCVGLSDLRPNLIDS